MLGKLLKYDLKKNMRWLWILFLSTIVVAGVARGCKEIGKTLVFFKILAIIFESVFYALAVNVILQPFLRNFLNFAKSFYSDESYLTHTLPVTKNQLINSKFITALIEIVLGFVTLIISLLIMFMTPTMFDTLKLIISTAVSGNFSVFGALSLFIILVIVEFLMFISIIFLAIIMAYKSKEKRVFKAFIISTALAFVFLTLLSFIMVVVLLICKVDLTSTTLMLSSGTALSVMLSGIIVYTLAIVLCYFLSKKFFNEGVNVD